MTLTPLYLVCLILMKMFEYCEKCNMYYKPVMKVHNRLVIDVVI